MAHAIPASMVLRLSLCLRGLVKCDAQADESCNRTHMSSRPDPTKVSHGKYVKAMVVRDTSSELDKDLDKDNE